MKRLRLPAVFGWALSFCLMVTACSKTPVPWTPQQIHEHNRAVALMGQYEYQQAEKILASLAQQLPEDLSLQVDWSVALLNRQEQGDVERALAIAQKVLAREPHDARAAYVAGLLELYLGHPDRAKSLLELAASRVKDDAYVFYFLGQALQQEGDLAKALNAYRKAVKLNPELASAWYGAAMVARRLGQKEEAAEWLRRYQSVKNSPRSLLAEFKYTRMGPLAMVRPHEVNTATRAVDNHPGLDELLAGYEPIGHGQWPEHVQIAAIWRSADEEKIATVGDGVLKVGTRTGQSVTTIFRAPVTGIAALAWSDLENQGKPQLLTCGHDGVGVWHNSGKDWKRRFLHQDRAACSRLLTIDWDHDGDLDVIVARRDALVILVNLDDGKSFESRALLAVPSGVEALATVDWDWDRDVDLVWSDGKGGLHWLENKLLGQPVDHVLQDSGGSPLTALAVQDSNSDGHWGLLALDRQGSLAVWQSGELVRQPLDGGAGRELMPIFWGLDGRTVVAAVTDRQVFLLTREGPQQPVRVARSIARRNAVVIPDLASMDTPAFTIFSSQKTGATWEQWASKAHGQHWLTLTLAGAQDGQALRTNQWALGTLVRARAGRQWATLWAHRTGTRAQHVLPYSLWLGRMSHVDYVELRWPDGVYQTELQVASGARTVVETERQLSSCPVLFIKNENGYQFVTDVLGVGGLGFMHEPGHYSEPRPWEFIRLPDETLAGAKTSGFLDLQLTEPMEENTYLDSVRLHRWVLPSDWHMVLDERMGTGAPLPTGRPVFYSQSWLPAKAQANGQDVLAALKEADGHPVPLRAVSRRYLGSLDKPLRLELSFPVRLDTGKLGLVADAWVEYPYSQTLLAAHQAGRQYEPPSIEIKVNGVWRPWRVHVGYPAGMPRETYFPLGELPKGTTAVALVTNLEVYWDRIRLIRDEGAAIPLEHNVYTPEQADLRYLGYPRRSSDAWKRPQFDFSVRRPLSDMKNLEGLYTRFGDVRPLLIKDDGAFVVYGSGESVHLVFDFHHEAPPPGHRAVYALEFRGYAKDMDLYTRHGGKVEPLPPPAQAGAKANRTLHQRFNQRPKGFWGAL